MSDLKTIIDTNNYELKELDILCRRNCRDYSFTRDGRIITFDKYDGCDGRISESISDAIEWEKGYLSIFDSDDQDKLMPSVAPLNEKYGFHQ